MKHIAEQAGVSRATVGFVLNEQHGALRISEQTRQRVLRTAQELGYLPNSSARAVRRGKFGCVALLLSAVPGHSYVPYSLLDGIQAALAEHDLHLTLATLPDAKLTDQAYVPKLLREWMADGLLVNYNVGLPEPLVQLIRAHQLPSIWINVKQPADCVYPDDLDTGLRAARHLLGLGHRRIAYVDYNFGAQQMAADVHYSTGERERGYRQAMREAGLPGRVVRGDKPVPDPEQVAFTLPWLSGPERPTAVIAYAPENAAAIFYAATARLHLRVPQDLSLVTIAPPSDKMVVHLGTVFTNYLLPEHALGQTAVQMLLQKIAEPSRLLPPRALTLTFEAGQTLGPAPT